MWRRIRRCGFANRGNLNHYCAHQHVPYYKLPSVGKTALKITTLRNIKDWYISSICHIADQPAPLYLRQAICLLGYGKDYMVSEESRRLCLRHKDTFPFSSLPPPPAGDVSPESISRGDISAEVVIWFIDNLGLGYDRGIVAFLKEELKRVNVSSDVQKEKIANEFDRKNLWEDILKREEIYSKYIYPLRQQGA